MKVAILHTSNPKGKHIRNRKKIQAEQLIPAGTSQNLKQLPNKNSHRSRSIGIFSFGTPNGRRPYCDKIKFGDFLSVNKCRKQNNKTKY